MTRRRRTANPIFQRPLTTAEATKQTIVPKINYLRCLRCGQTGTQHGGLHKVEDGWYECNDTIECEALAKVMKERRKTK
uniref:Uncharacterized protein n=2 Tax=viral metagenome TaxID=1070528 RepID=A0A6M3JHH5_9ZZZZ